MGISGFRHQEDGKCSAPLCSNVSNRVFPQAAKSPSMAVIVALTRYFLTET